MISLTTRSKADTFCGRPFEQFRGFCPSQNTVQCPRLVTSAMGRRILRLSDFPSQESCGYSDKTYN